MIKKKGNKWFVLSEEGRNLGGYRSKEAAQKRLRQIEFFKHQGKIFFRKTKMTRGIKESRKEKQ